MTALSSLLSGVLLPLFLCLAGLFFLIYLKGAPLLRLFSNLKQLKSRKDAGHSPFKAVILALAGTLGVGNMVGVAAAIKEGGAGVLFWMWVSALLAMVVKFAEIKLSMLHRVLDKDGRPQGGAMYYMPRPFDRFFALLCILCALTVGGAMQSDACVASLSVLLPIPSIFFPLFLCLPLIFTLIRGKGRIFDLSAVLVPVMSLLYIVMCAFVLYRYRTALPSVFSEIFRGAFDIKSAALGGGCGMLTALRLGVVRGILSNEAGCGTAPMAHAAASTEKSDAQGALGIVEVAFDTLLLCSLTGLSLLVYPPALKESSAISMILSVFSSVFGRVSTLLLPLSVLLFAFATVLCWCYYGKQCVSFLTRKSLFLLLFDILFLTSLLLAPLFGEQRILAICDPVISAMTLLNLTALLFHRKELKKKD